MLDELSKKIGVTTRMISAENPTGKKGMACLAQINPDDPDNYWSRNAVEYGMKVRPFIRIKPKDNVVLADIEGPAVIKQLFLTSDRANFNELILRIYWDNEEKPSVECPMGAFFLMGHDNVKHNVYSLPIVVAPHTGCNSYFEMPFRKHARIELENTGETYTEVLAYKVLYEEREVKDDVGYFHTQYNHSVTEKEKPIHTILDNVNGEGIYVGTYIAIGINFDGWWGEGEVKFYLDDDINPSIADNGTEDYFGGAWNFGGYGIVGDQPEQVFNSPFLGLPLAKVDSKPKLFGMYRFHIEDCIGFKKNIKVTVQTLGWPNGSTYKYISEEIKSVAYYYLRHK